MSSAGQPASGISRRAMLKAGGAVVGGYVGGTADATAARAHAAVEPPSPAPAARVTVSGTDPVALAAEMIKFDTSHAGRSGSDTGGGAVTLAHARMLEGLWRSAGVPTELVPTPKADNVHLIARVTGRGDHPPLLFMAHSDVVTVERSRWSRDPYGGAVEDGWLYGRGAVDMKGASAAFMAALLRHVREGAEFDRDIIFLSDCDEEGGPYGAQWLVDNHYDKVTAGVAVTEGGWVLNQPDGTTPMLASLSCRDRVSLLLELTATGVTTHSSHPDDGPAVGRLGGALARLARHRPAIGLSDLVREYFTVLARSTRDQEFSRAITRLLAAGTQQERDAAGARVIELSDYPWVHTPMLRATLSFLGQQAGYYTSIVPSTARADVRVGFVPDGEDPARVVAEIRRLVAEWSVTVRVVGRPDETEEQILARVRKTLSRPTSPVTTDVYDMWKRAARETYPGIGVVPSQFEANTSAGPWRDKGIPVYGLYPYAVDGDTVTRMHGDDERVRVTALRTGTDMVYRMLAGMRTG
ncbi:M20/M25/M40 family metallo-hydrolase [Streptosporangium sp. NPDC003464]